MYLELKSQKHLSDFFVDIGLENILEGGYLGLMVFTKAILRILSFLESEAKGGI